MMIQTQKLTYADHSDDIAALSKILADIQRMGPFAPDMQETVDFILKRLDHLQNAQEAHLSLFDQNEERR